MPNLIKKNIEFESPLPLLECKQLTLDYFNRLGFKNPIETTNSISFKRGNKFTNSFTTNPLKWMSEINVIFYENNGSVNVKGNFYVNSKNQLVTSEEIEVWDLTTKLLQKCLQSGKIDTIPLKTETKKVQKSSLKTLFSILLGAIIGGGIGTFLAIKTDLIILIPIFTIIGSLIFLKIGIKNNK